MYLTDRRTESQREWMFNHFEYAERNDKKIKHIRFWQKGDDLQEIFLTDYSDQNLSSFHNYPVTAEFVNRPEEHRNSSAIDYAGGKGLLKVITTSGFEIEHGFMLSNHRS